MPLHKFLPINLPCPSFHFAGHFPEDQKLYLLPEAARESPCAQRQSSHLPSRPGVLRPWITRLSQGTSHNGQCSLIFMCQALLWPHRESHQSGLHLSCEKTGSSMSHSSQGLGGVTPALAMIPRWLLTIGTTISYPSLSPGPSTSLTAGNQDVSS